MAEHLTWVETNVIDELVGALSAAASLCEHRPNMADAIRDETVRQLGAAERGLVRYLHNRLEEAAFRVGT
jgi:hypothetical protein